jgi:molybdopterin synthase sulfur carrier subunit
MIKIFFFASYREQVGLSEVQLAVKNGSVSVHDVITRLKERFGARGAFLDDPHLLVSVNQQMVNRQSLVRTGDEMAFFPPVTGG